MKIEGSTSNRDQVGQPGDKQPNLMKKIWRALMIVRKWAKRFNAVYDIFKAVKRLIGLLTALLLTVIHYGWPTLVKVAVWVIQRFSGEFESL